MKVLIHHSLYDMRMLRDIAGCRFCVEIFFAVCQLYSVLDFFFFGVVYQLFSVLDLSSVCQVYSVLDFLSSVVAVECLTVPNCVSAVQCFRISQLCTSCAVF